MFGAGLKCRFCLLFSILSILLVIHSFIIISDEQFPQFILRPISIHKKFTPL
jgi:hypothetical protein